MKATMRIVGRVRNRTGGFCQALARQLLTRCTTGNRYQSDALPMRPKKSPGRATFSAWCERIHPQIEISDPNAQNGQSAFSLG